jgi:hypothetical protein
MTPPRIATWLLQHLGCDPNNEAIVGDLVEQYRAGRSRMWYRGQALRALIVGVCGRLTQRPFLSLFCLASGSILAALFSAFLQRVLLPYEVIGPLSYRVFYVVLCIACAASVHLTRSVARFFQREGRAFVLLYVIVFCPALCVYWLRILVHFHDAQTTRSVLLAVMLNYGWIITTLTPLGITSFRQGEENRIGL